MIKGYVQTHIGVFCVLGMESGKQIEEEMEKKKQKEISRGGF